MKRELMGVAPNQVGVEANSKTVSILAADQKPTWRREVIITLTRAQAAQLVDDLIRTAGLRVRVTE